LTLLPADFPLQLRHRAGCLTPETSQPATDSLASPGPFLGGQQDGGAGAQRGSKHGKGDESASVTPSRAIDRFKFEMGGVFSHFTPPDS
jgi:hypothetical protein